MASNNEGKGLLIYLRFAVSFKGTVNGMRMETQGQPADTSVRTLMPQHRVEQTEHRMETRRRKTSN